MHRHHKDREKWGKVSEIITNQEAKGIIEKVDTKQSREGLNKNESDRKEMVSN